jgi:lipopolysaccharide export system permease protein
MIKQVDRYVGTAALTGTLVIWIGLTLLFMVFSLLNELRGAENQFGTGDVFWYIGMMTPKLAYQVFPVSALLGTLTGVGALAAANELVAFRTAGVSRLRLAAAAMGGVLLVTIPIMIVGEWVAPDAEQRARAFKRGETTGRQIIGGPRGMWMREGNDIVNIQLPVLASGDAGHSVAFNQVVIYGFDDELKLKSITRAARAIHHDSGWELEKVYGVQFSERGATRTREKQRLWPSDVRPELLDSAVTRPWRLSMRSLVGYIDYLRQNGLDDRVYLAALWEKAFFPLTAVALVLAGMPFVFSSIRSHNLGVRLFIGMTIGGAFMIVNEGVQNYASVYGLSPLMSNLGPALLLALAAVAVLRRSV